VYDGEWEENKIQGFGRMTYPDGTYYEGKWKKGYKHGKGTLKKKNGKHVYGEWKMGELVVSSSKTSRK